MSQFFQHIRQSLSLKLSIGILLMTAIIFISLLGILFIESRRHILQVSTDHANSVLNVVEQQVRCYLNTIETATTSNDFLAVQNFQPDSLLEYSRRIVLLNGNVDGCSITAAPNTFPQYGRYFSAYTVRQADTIVTVREGEYNYFEKPWYKTPVNLGKACWVDPFDDYNEGTLSAEGKIASYCKPLYSLEGKLLGVISTDLSLTKLSTIISAEAPFPNAYYRMIGRKDTLGLGIPQQEQGSMRVAVEGVPSLVCYRPVQGSHWRLILVCPESDIFKGYYVLTNIIIGIILIGLVCIFLFCRHIVSHAIRPLNRLLDQTQRIAQGKYNETIAHTERKDVVGRLQNSFATMQESIGHHVTDIQRINEGRIQRNGELRQARLSVEEANRQKTVFIQNVTHQIRTPLNIILGFAQVLRDSYHTASAEDVSNMIDMMQHQVLTLNRMVLMLYDSSDVGLTEELNSQKKEQVSCNEVAYECIEATHRHFPGLPVVFHTTLPDDFCILTNRLYLMRSLRELLYNSAKYSDGQHISVSVSATDKSVRFVYTDTGTGISAAVSDKMFAPFVKINDLSEGLGLGLPLAKRHILNLGGDLILDTDYHEGCRFVVELPL